METEIDDVIQELWSNDIKITIKRVAEELNTTFYLVRWYFSDDKLEVIRDLNKKMRDEKLISKAVELIDILTDNGNRLKMRKLKQLSSIRDYALLKEAVSRYQSDVQHSSF